MPVNLPTDINWNTMIKKAFGEMLLSILHDGKEEELKALSSFLEEHREHSIMLYNIVWALILAAETILRQQLVKSASIILENYFKDYSGVRKQFVKMNEDHAWLEVLPTSHTIH